MFSPLASIAALLVAQTIAAPGLLGPSDDTKSLDPAAPTCRDGGKLHCCQATFSGSAAPVTLAADLLCYDITPAVVNCIISTSPSPSPSTSRANVPLTADAPIDAGSGCVGEYSCCQVNDLNPILGMFCSKPPGDCIGAEGGDAGGKPYCEEILKGRFGHCTDNDIRNNRLLMGLGVGQKNDSLLGLGVAGLKE